MRRHELTDEEWAVIAPFLPNKPRGVARVDDRRMINGILWRFRTGAPWRNVPERYGPRTTPYNRLWRFRTGAPWRNVPERYGPRTTPYNRFVRWRAAGVWDRLLEAVSAAYDGDIVMIDASCVRVHQHGAAIKKGATTIVAWDAPGAA
ncbi:transposase [Ancylobacter defluvii]|uniref:Transposase n=1 Tax=Ancylobacter defluvii TaxID=1282440 RepID=A0A9W6NCU0_9HYPH|nr:transposase [Ancylobacter defluvii]